MLILLWFLVIRLLFAQTETPTQEPTPTVEISPTATPTLVPTNTSTPTAIPTSSLKPFANIQTLPATIIKNETFSATISLENLSVGKTYYIKFFSVSSTSAFDTLNGSTWLSGTSSWSSFPYVVSTNQSQTTSIQSRSSQAGAFNDLKIRLRESGNNYDSTTQSSITVYEPTPTPTTQPTLIPTQTLAPTQTPTPIPTNTPTQAPTGYPPTSIPSPTPTPAQEPTPTVEELTDPTPTVINEETPIVTNGQTTIQGEILGSNSSDETTTTATKSTSSSNLLPVILITIGGLIFLLPLFISFLKK